MFWYLGAWSLGLLIVRLTLGAESAAGLGRESVALLWFLGVYLVTLAFVPALARMSSGRAVAMLLAALLAAAAVMDGIRFAVGTPEAGVANFVIVWLIPVAIGVAYARRLIGRPRRPLRRDIGLHRPGGTRCGRALRGVARRHGGGAGLQRLAADTGPGAALRVDVVCVRSRGGRDPALGAAAAASGAWSPPATGER